MTELDNELRAKGGMTRAKNQSEGERKFQAMIAAARRPLLRDVNFTPESLLADFKRLAESRHWFVVLLVGADRSTIPLTTDAEVLRGIERHGALGFLGVTLLGSRVQVYGKPLRRGVKAVEDLDRVSRDVLAKVLDKLGVTKLDESGS